MELVNRGLKTDSPVVPLEQIVLVALLALCDTVWIECDCINKPQHVSYSLVRML